MPLAPVLLAAVIGAVIGSFLTVVIARVPAGESIVRPRSRCPRCGMMIRARDNVPILSYLVRRGRCARCRAPISIRYPLTELATALLFAGTTAWTWQTDRLPLLPAALYLVAIGVALTAIDIDVHRLPNAIVLPSYPVVAVLLTVAAWASGDWTALLRAVIAGAALFAFYALLALVYPAGMGWGDVKLAGIVGGALGYLGWAALLVGGFGAFILGAVAAIVVIARRRGGAKSALPFGPFMLTAMVVGATTGQQIASGYLALVGA